MVNDGEKDGVEEPTRSATDGPSPAAITPTKEDLVTRNNIFIQRLKEAYTKLRALQRRFPDDVTRELSDIQNQLKQISEPEHIDEGFLGWLNDKQIDMLLATEVIPPNTKVLLAQPFEAFLMKPQSNAYHFQYPEIDDMGEVTRLIVPYNITGNHWALMVIEKVQVEGAESAGDNTKIIARNIDSLEPARITQPNFKKAFESAVDYICQSVGWLDLDIEIDLQAGQRQQNNFEDCGIWVWKNALALMQASTKEPFDLATFQGSVRFDDITLRHDFFEIINEKLTKAEAAINTFVALHFGAESEQAIIEAGITTPAFEKIVEFLPSLTVEKFNDLTNYESTGQQLLAQKINQLLEPIARKANNQGEMRHLMLVLRNVISDALKETPPAQAERGAKDPKVLKNIRASQLPEIFILASDKQTLATALKDVINEKDSVLKKLVNKYKADPYDLLAYYAFCTTPGEVNHVNEFIKAEAKKQPIEPIKPKHSLAQVQSIDTQYSKIPEVHFLKNKTLLINAKAAAGNASQSISEAMAEKAAQAHGTGTSQAERTA